MFCSGIFFSLLFPRKCTCIHFYLRDGRPGMGNESECMLNLNSVSVRKCIVGWRRSARHINWQTGTAVSEVDTSNLLLQKRMPPPECASLISNLVLISSCCPLRRIRWQVGFEDSLALSLSLSLLPLSLLIQSFSHCLSLPWYRTKAQSNTALFHLKM